MRAPLAAVNTITLCPVFGAQHRGPNQLGDVGDGSYVAKRGASAVVGGFRWRTLSAGSSHVCGITLDDEAYCWGNQFRGALGNGQFYGSSPAPVAVLGGLTFTSVYAGAGTSCGLTAAGDAYCWGNNDRGQFGTGVTSRASSPELIAAPGTYVAVTAGGNHTCGLTAAGIAFCWGQGDYGQLGDGMIGDRLRPVQVAGYE